MEFSWGLFKVNIHLALKCILHCMLPFWFILGFRLIPISVNTNFQAFQCVYCVYFMPFCGVSILCQALCETHILNICTFSHLILMAASAMIPILQMKELRFREVQGLEQSELASKGQSTGIEYWSLDSNCYVLIYYVTFPKD